MPQTYTVENDYQNSRFDYIRSISGGSSEMGVGVVEAERLGIPIFLIDIHNQMKLDWVDNSRSTTETEAEYECGVLPAICQFTTEHLFNVASKYEGLEEWTESDILENRA